MKYYKQTKATSCPDLKALISKVKDVPLKAYL